MASTLLWYDIETFGRSPVWDKVSQFACVRTNDSFEQIGESIILYCKITPDYLPDPQACFITGITPQETIEKGLSEYDFIKEIDKQFSVPGTCVIGYNNLRFDDEFMRNLYYRNFFDPYTREWKNGNSRWDLIDPIRTAHDLRPEGINWPQKENGRPDFKLENLAKANGIEHENAHDALADVYATINLAKLFHEKQPRLFKWLFTHRAKKDVAQLIDLEEKTPLVHTSRMFTNDKGCTSIISPIVTEPINRNAIISFNLSHDPTPLIELSVDEIRKRIFTPWAQLPNKTQRIPLKSIHINKCPVLAPLAALDKASQLRLGLDVEKCLKHHEIIKNNPEILQKVRMVFSPDNKSENEKTLKDDPDLQIYSGGFFLDDDKNGFKMIHQSPPDQLQTLAGEFHDKRIPEMLRRFRGRNFNESLNKKEQSEWINFCAGRILMPPVSDGLDFGNFIKKLANYSKSVSLSASEQRMVQSLSEYAETIKSTILDWQEPTTK